MSRSRVIVEFPDRPAYHVRIGDGLLAQLGGEVRAAAREASRCLVICDGRSAVGHLAAIGESLASAGFQVADISISAVDASEAWGCVAEIHRALSLLALPEGSPVVVCAGAEAGGLASFAVSLCGGRHPLAIAPASTACALRLLGRDDFEIDAGLGAPLRVKACPALGVVDVGALAGVDAAEADAGLSELKQASAHCDGDFRQWLAENEPALSRHDEDACVLALTQVLASRADAIGAAIRQRLQS